MYKSLDMLAGLVVVAVVVVAVVVMVNAREYVGSTGIPTLLRNILSTR